MKKIPRAHIKWAAGNFFLTDIIIDSEGMSNYKSHSDDALLKIILFNDIRKHVIHINDAPFKKPLACPLIYVAVKEA